MSKLGRVSVPQPVTPLSALLRSTASVSHRRGGACRVSGVGTCAGRTMTMVAAERPQGPLSLGAPVRNSEVHRTVGYLRLDSIALAQVRG
jgi:hypothetical protein